MGKGRRVLDRKADRALSNFSDSIKGASFKDLEAGVERTLAKQDESFNRQIDKFDQQFGQVNRGANRMLDALDSTSRNDAEVQRLMEQVQSEVRLENKSSALTQKVARSGNRELSTRMHKITRDKTINEIESRLNQLRGTTPTVKELEDRLDALKKDSPIRRADRELVRVKRQQQKKQEKRQSGRMVDLRRGAMETIDFDKSYYRPERQQLDRSKDTRRYQKELDAAKTRLKSYYRVLAKVAKLSPQKSEQFLNRHYKKVDAMGNLLDVAKDKQAVLKTYSSVVVKNSITKPLQKTQQIKGKGTSVMPSQRGNKSPAAIPTARSVSNKSLVDRQLETEKRRLKMEYGAFAKSLPVSQEKQKEFYKHAVVSIDNAVSSDTLKKGPGQKLSSLRISIDKAKTPKQKLIAAQRANLHAKAQAAAISKQYQTGQQLRNTKETLKSLATPGNTRKGWSR